MVDVDVFETKKKASKYYFLESIPSDCKFPPDTKIYPTTGYGVIKMLQKSKVSIKAISFYFTLRGKDVEGGPYKTADVGEEIYKKLDEAAQRGVSIHLLANVKGPGFMNEDMTDLKAQYPNNVNIGFIDMSKKTPGFLSGICHTKLWIVDDKYFYVGSSNMDWRSYTEIVETGILGKNHTSVMNNLNTLFFESAKLADSSEFVQVLMQRNKQSFADMKTEYLSYSPVQISSSPFWIGRDYNITHDKQALIDVINSAKKKLYMSTYEYATFDFYSTPHLNDGTVNDALIEAAFVRKVEVNIIVDSKCTKGRSMLETLHRLLKTPGITIKIFEIKDKVGPEIAFAKLWHSKLAVSESKLWISTNNIYPSYFQFTCGIGIKLEATTKTYKEEIMPLIESATDHFTRYWNSEYCETLLPDPFSPYESVE